MDLVYWLLGPEAFRYYFIAVAACSVEYVYGILLTRAPSAEHRSRGYALMYDAVASVVMGAVFVAAVAALAPLALAGFNIPSPDEASERYTFAVERFEAYLIDLAELEKWLAWTAILAPLVGVITSSSLLARISLQMLLALAAAMKFALTLLEPAAPLMVGVGVALTGVSRLRRLGPYLVFSSLGALVVACGVSVPLYDCAQGLKFKRSFGWEDLSAVWSALTGQIIPLLIEDGELAARTLVAVSIGVAIAGAVTAAASAAAGGLVDSIVNRIRL